MAFEINTTSKSKNQFSARILSRNEGNAMICWAHVTDQTARSLFGVKSVEDITYAAAAEKLPMLLDNERTFVVVTDMLAELAVVPVDQY